jgi:hypothetical protein
MDIISMLIHNPIVLAGIILVSLGLGGRVPLVVGIILIVLGIVLH